jgi:hypothetical protein
MHLLRFGQVAVIGLCFASSLLANDAFSIPAFAGTQVSQHDGYQNQVNLPLITTFAVFKTQNGSPLPEQDVLEFYRSYYEKRGWKQSVFYKPTSEPYLELQQDLSQPAHPHSAIHLAGHLNLWVAPKDGVITVFLSQWRNSSLDSATNELFHQTVNSLKSSGKTLGYSVSELQPQASWAKYYEDENLVTMADFWLSLPSKQPRSCMDGSGMIFVTVLAYKDPAAAAEHGNPPAREPLRVEDRGNGSYVVQVEIVLPRTGSVLLRGNLVILLQPGDDKQGDAINQLVKTLTPAP